METRCQVFKVSGHDPTGEDAVEPLALLTAPFGINVLYTPGWLVEVPARVLRPALSPQFGPLLLKLGLGLGLSLITLPAALWGGYRVLQLAGFVSLSAEPFSFSIIRTLEVLSRS